MSNKKDDMRKERLKMPKIKDFLESILEVSFREATLSEQRDQGIDLVNINDLETYEIKIRSSKYRDNCYTDCLLETQSNDNYGTEGWIYHSKARWLIIIYEPLDDPIAQMWGLPELRDWWQENIHRRVWKKKRVPQSHGGYTVNRIIPLKFIAEWVPFHYLGNLTTHNSH